jgi:alginate O-acetyltransferase complex protein AlgI
MAALFGLALWLAGIGHFVLLGASFQVPARLGWKEDLAQLRPFNRKLMWTYGAFTVLTIVAFGSLTFILHDDFLRGDSAAIGLAAFIAAYWTSRIVVDAVYFKHGDWPSGRSFVIGHVMLTGLFIALASTYAGLIVWRLLMTVTT